MRKMNALQRQHNFSFFSAKKKSFDVGIAYRRLSVLLSMHAAAAAAAACLLAYVFACSTFELNSVYSRANEHQEHPKICQASKAEKVQAQGSLRRIKKII